MNVVDKINKVEGMLREEYLIDKISNKYKIDIKRDVIDKELYFNKKK